MTATRDSVDFVYVGGPRCGSTWLAAVLSDHPEIFVPPSKEIHFFNDRMPYTFEYRYPLGMAHYLGYFDQAEPGQLRGDISPFYFLDPNAAWRIHRHLPDARIISFLRDPVDMLYSLYLLLRQRERRAPTFEAELEANPQLLDLCRFDRLLQPYYDLFERERILVLLHGDLKRDARATARRIFRFLGVDEDFAPPSVERKFNLAVDSQPSRGKQARGYAIRALNHPALLPVKRLILRQGLKDIRYFGAQEGGDVARYQGPAEATRAWIGELLAPDMERLAARIGRDLSGWPSCRSAKAAAPPQQGQAAATDPERASAPSSA